MLQMPNGTQIFSEITLPKCERSIDNLVISTDIYIYIISCGTERKTLTVILLKIA